MIRFAGRRTGAECSFPVGVLDVAGETVITSRHAWRFNFAGGAPCAVRGADGWQDHRATLVTDPYENARLWAELIAATGIRKAKRDLGLDITVGRRPTHEEIVDAAERIGISIIRFDPPITGTT